MEKVLYEELCPDELVQRLQEMPVAYLPLGTLEWHGPHMPLGADGIQSKELFVRVAEKIGGVVLPMLFMGPDRVFHDGEKSFYGMDINTEGALKTYCVQQMKGSAYWMEKELFQNYLRSILAQLSRVGVRIVVGHGHGPSIKAFQELKEEAEENEANGVRCMEDAGRGYRVVVASPMPQRIRELETIKTLVNAGHIVITCGGGGIPVVSENGKLVGVNAVIDKDNASSLLAAQLGADYLVILTAVEKVAINFGKENQEWLSDLTVDQAKEYIAEEQFAKGSMLPKIEAGISFIEKGEGRAAVITDMAHAKEGYEEKAGTIIR